jgi:hypothetical protein
VITIWLVTNFGFFSAVTRKPKDISVGDNRVLQIRARDPKHLDLLRERYMGDELGPNVVFRNTDYQVRAFCTREAWGRAVYAASQDVDYDNFKGSILGDDDLHDAAMGVWSALASQYGTNYDFQGYYPKGGKRKAGDRSFRTAGSGYAAGSTYQSAFGPIEGDDRIQGRSWPYTETIRVGYEVTTPSGATSKYDPFATEPEAGTAVEVFDADVLDDWDGDEYLGGGTQARIDELLTKYMPPPEELPDVLTARDVKDYLRITSRLLREFLSANASWRMYKGPGGVYQFPKSKLLFLEEDFNIWHSEKLARDRDFINQ